VLQNVFPAPISTPQMAHALVSMRRMLAQARMLGKARAIYFLFLCLSY